jgi:sterol desaturase/sphingolipid hydroxylase (fatty acid hydroxylase superfamily)
METLRQYTSQFAVDFLRLCVWLILLLVIFVPLEKLAALHPRRVFRKAFSTDLAYYFVTSLLPKMVLVLPLTLAASASHALAPGGLYRFTATLPFGVRLMAGLLVGEVGYYWGHRLTHQIPFLWRFHAIHHSAEEIDWLVNTRAHPVDFVFTRLCGLVPMYVLGLAQPMGTSLDLVPVIVTLLGTLWGFFIHANIRWRFGWLEWLVALPAFHHWHHANNGPERSQNYASMFPFLDGCFGTLVLPAKDWPERYGIDSAMAPGLAGQLLEPLMGRESVASASSRPDPAAL